jgi:hypothetical protein
MIIVFDSGLNELKIANLQFLPMGCSHLGCEASPANNHPGVGLERSHRLVAHPIEAIQVESGESSERD